MQSDISATSCVYSFSTTSELTSSQEQVDSSIVADLATSECCDMETMLNVLLNYCRDLPPPPNTASITSTPQLLSTEKYPDGLPGASSEGTARPSAATPQYHGSPDPNSAGNPSGPATQPSENPTDPPTQPDLLQPCLQGALEHCKNAELQGFLDEFKKGKDKARYVPLANALNCGLSLSSTMQVPEIRGPSELKPLFVVSDPDWFHWRSGVQRNPELALLSLSAVRQLYDKPHGDWNSLSKTDLDLPEEAKFEWPDALAPVEVKWNESPIQSERPKEYSTCLVPISHLSVDDERKDSTGDTSSNTTPASTTTSSSIPSSRRVQSPLSMGSSDNLAPESIPSSHSGRSLAKVSGQATNSKLWLWWYDPQGAIQTTGIDFIQNLPHLLVLLFALQRLTLVDWGFNPELDPSIALRHLPTKTDGKQKKSSKKNPSTPRIEPMSAEVDVNKELKIRYDVPMLDLLHDPFCLSGRSTKSFEVTDASDVKASDAKASPKRYVAKLYWPYMSRFKEEDLIKAARGVADDLGNHLPLVIGSRDIDPMGTFRIRQELGLKPTTSSSRALRMIIFERLIPITDLQGDKFLIASLCSVAQRSERCFGVLNDWDLSFWAGHGEFEADLTATIPYVAINLLYAWQEDSKSDRKYYFELESFFWCMILTFLAVKDRKLQPTPAVAGWLTGDISQSVKDRSDYLRRPRRFHVYEAWTAYRDMGFEISEWIHDRTLDLERKKGLDDDLVLLRCFLEMVSRKVADLEMPTSPKVEGLYCNSRSWFDVSN
ncbi:tRNA(Met) cytidine acetyltransferase TmcA [Pyrococcus abyssi GE5] [Rhizoctonia solani]|uniref:tRNA(Met) cytidine acetyltransferase TmcA [Pyrococcus abyssi GE5] n=1 Tax=Rhizoctonia solani TaxID=456999 RepID=A0A0K6G3W0_9AGAM|nr:tRNA(Met) cytidine acetyltransferase TmcA [Pyrococcus abyssi GE5] [Rhizoctonia solani]